MSVRVVVIMVMTAIGPMHVRFDPEALMVGMAMMRVAVMMGVIAIMIMMFVAVFMPVRVRRSAHVGAAFRVERRFDRDDLSAQAPRHLLDYRIPANAQALLQEFGRQMAIAKMPGDARQRRRVGGANFGQRLRRGDDLDDARIVEHEGISGAAR